MKTEKYISLYYSMWIEIKIKMQKQFFFSVKLPVNKCVIHTKAHSENDRLKSHLHSLYYNGPLH